MTIKLSYGTIDELMQAFDRMGTLTGKIGYAILRTKRNIQSEYQIYLDLRNNLIMKYAEEGSNGIKPGDKNFPQFAQEYFELLNTEIDADVHQVDKSDYDIDAVYCETAQARDYDLIENLLVKEDKQDDAQSGTGTGEAADKEPE